MTRSIPLDDVTGGCLNSIHVQGDRVVKSYAGTLDRGFQKLRAEYAWLRDLPGDLVGSFAKPTDLRDDTSRKTIELHLERLPLSAATKAILGGALAPRDVSEIIQHSLSFLSTRLYDLRGDHWSGGNLYESFHRKRITLAKKYLQRIPYMIPILTCGEITVNGIRCPSINRFLLWLDRNHTSAYADCRVVAIHGNFHLDNIMIPIPWSFERRGLVTFIDPRGDLLGPPHCDLAKILITLEAFYDEIHYGRFAVRYSQHGRRYAMDLEVDRELDDHYLQGLIIATRFLEEFSRIEGVPIVQFLRSMLVTECIHILSFSFYHAYRADTEPDRIRAFVGAFALLTRRLMDNWDNVEAVQLDRRILRET